MTGAPPREIARKPRPGDAVTLRITGLGPDGHGVAREDVLVGPGREPARLVFDVPRAVPGDTVEATVGSVRRRRLRARLDALVTPSPERVAPRCPHFGGPGDPLPGCGGCALQALAYPEQLAWKAARVARLLGEAGVPPEALGEPLGMDVPWDYRNKLELTFGHDADGRYAVGMRRLGRRHDVVRLEACYLESPEAVALARLARDAAEARGLAPFRPHRGEGFLRTLTVREGKRTGQRLVELTTTGDEAAALDGGEAPAEQAARALLDAVVAGAEALGVALTSAVWTRQHAVRGQPTRFELRPHHGPPCLEEALHVDPARPLRFRVHPRAFFQPNTLQAERLYREVLRAAGLGEGPPRGHVLDLYCGTGTIALCMAPHAARVTGVELVPEAVEDARANAALNGLDHVAFHAGDVGAVLASEGLAAPGAVDLVVVDPPRAGLSPEALAQVAALAPPRLVYVSCNPEALARDVRGLAEAGLRVASARAVDMFPHTPHVETVALLTRG